MNAREIEMAQSLALSIAKDSRWPSFREYIRTSLGITGLVESDKSAQALGVSIGIHRVITTIEEVGAAEEKEVEPLPNIKAKAQKETRDPVDPDLEES
jgi:hypothetical protein